MSRTEAIAIITRKIAKLDDDQVSLLANVVDDFAERSSTHLALTAEELVAVERSKEDFKTGRTPTSDQYHAEMPGSAPRSDTTYRLSDEERRMVREGIAELDRGEYASDAAVEAVLRRPWA